jgi:Cof subfamily protein (haloacid dehalogenase superfamily)
MVKHVLHLDTASLPATEIDLAFFDIDGTILDGSDKISPRTREAILELQRTGVGASLATGRPYFGALNVIDELKIVRPSVFFSGALVITPGEKTASYESPLSPEETRRAVEAARRGRIYCELYTATEYFVEERSALAEMHYEYLKRKPVHAPFDDLISRERILKLVMISNGKNEEAVLNSIRSELPDLNFGMSYGAAHPQIVFANITSQRATRQAAFDFIVGALKLEASRIISFGDAEADIPFLQLSGIGVAMDNAHQKVKDAARYVTDSVRNDGVALALERLNLKPGRRFGPGL